MVQHNLDEIYEELTKNRTIEKDFWYVKHKSFEPFTCRLKNSQNPYLKIRDINEDQEVQLNFEEVPSKRSFIKSVETWLEKWSKMKED